MTSLPTPSNNLQPLPPPHPSAVGGPPRPPMLPSSSSSNCVRCHKTIRDPYVLTVQEQPHHPKCVQCQECSQYLEHNCYSQNDAFYCKKDFYRLYGPKCQGCDYTIEMDQYSTKIGDDAFFHPECLVCSVCKLTVPSGHRVKYQDGFVYCEDHAFMCHMKTSTATTVLPEMYERDSGIESDLSSNMGDHQHGYPQQQRHPPPPPPILQDLDQQKSPSGHDDVGCGDDKDGADSDDGKDDDDKGNKRRGPRTTIKAKQLEVLKTVFSQTPKPTRLMREQLAKETGLPMRVIQVWFQNKRSKEKRLHQMRFMARAPFLPPNARRFPGGDPRFCFPPGNGFDYGGGPGFDPNCGPYPGGPPPPPFNPHHNPHFNPHFSPSDGSGMIYPPPPHHPQQQPMPPHPGPPSDIHPPPPPPPGNEDGSTPPLLHSFPSPPPQHHDFSTPPPNGTPSDGFGPESSNGLVPGSGAEQCYPSPPLSLEYSTTPPTAAAGVAAAGGNNPPTAALGASS